MAQPQQQQPRPPVHQPMSDHIYTCNKIHDDGGEWMLADIDIRSFACKWTKNTSRALTFSSEQEVKDMIGVFDVLEGCYVARHLVGY